MSTDHLFNSSVDGALYDTRLLDWSRRAPLRAVYERHYIKISNAQQFKATLRAGPYAWPGGYPLYFVTDDGAAISFEGARKELREILAAITGNARGNGWRVVATAINYEDDCLYCDVTGERIESAYADDTGLPEKDDKS